MNNEEIINAIESFVKWGEDDKKKVLESLSDNAIQHMMHWLGQTRHGGWMNRKNQKDNSIGQYAFDLLKPKLLSQKGSIVYKS